MVRSMLYLAPYDVTLAGTGTSARGIQFLDYFAKRYELFVVLMEGFGHAPSRTLSDVSPNIPKEVALVRRVDYTDLGYFVFSRMLLREAQRVLESESIDVIFADFEKSGLYAYLLSKRFDIPYIYSSHNVEYLRYIDFARLDRRRYPLVPYIYLVERLSCQNATLITTITEEDAQIFRRWVSRSKMIVTPGGFDEGVMNPFYEEPPVDPPIVLFVGNFNNPGNKEAAYLIRDRIVEPVARKHPNVVFRLIGANPPRDIQHPNIDALGFVPDLRPHMQRANVVIVPVLCGGGIRIKTIEALACGKPIVATPKGVEGIHQDLESLTVTEVENFPRAIMNVLTQGRFLFREDYETVRDLFSATSILNRLDVRIREVLE